MHLCSLCRKNWNRAHVGHITLISVFSLFHYFHHHSSGPSKDQIADCPVVQIKNVEAVDWNHKLANLQIRTRDRKYKLFQVSSAQINISSLTELDFASPSPCCGTNNSTVQFSLYLFSTISGYLVHKFTAVASSSTSNCFGCDWASFSSHVACHAYLHPCESSWTLRLHGLDVARPVSSDHKAPAHCITDNLQTRRRQSHMWVCAMQKSFTQKVRKRHRRSHLVFCSWSLWSICLSWHLLHSLQQSSTIIFETCSHWNNRTAFLKKEGVPFAHFSLVLWKKCYKFLPQLDRKLFEVCKMNLPWRFSWCRVLLVLVAPLCSLVSWGLRQK